MTIWDVLVFVRNISMTMIGSTVAVIGYTTAADAFAMWRWKRKAWPRRLP